MNNPEVKILLHTCCAPCLIYPLRHLKQDKIFVRITGYFFNPNIYPADEYDLRRKTLKNYAESEKFEMIYENNSIEEFLRVNKLFEFEPEKRCSYCYFVRLEQTVKYAADNKFTHFSTTLLYSIYQKHELIKKSAEDLGKKYGVIFYYYDFREGWKEGVEYSRSIGMYRQKYCGCFSSLKKT